MASCSSCGKKGLFLRLSEGLCSSCQHKLNQAKETTCQVPFQNKSASNTDIDLAEQIIKSLSFGGEVSPRYKKKVLHITSDLGKQGAIAAYASELCGEPETAKGYYVKSKACELAGASHRAEVIKWTRKWIETGCAYSDTSNWSYPNCTPFQSRMSEAYERLGKALEGEYLFEESIEAYQKAWNHRPGAFHYINLIARVLTKMNRIDDAIKLLKETPLMEGETKQFRNAHIKELKEKKEKGYVYRPRKKKAIPEE